MGDNNGGPPEAAPVEWRGKTYKPLADGKYDAIVLGTGLKECILSGERGAPWGAGAEGGDGCVRVPCGVVCDAG